MGCARARAPTSIHCYFRIHMKFETASPAHGRLNRAVAVGSALRLPDAVVYDAYLVA